MAVVLYYGSGSPYAWRVWLALEHKGVSYDIKTLSFADGDLKTPEFITLNPRRRVPVLVDDGFALYESAAIMEYIDERWFGEPRLFSSDIRERGIQRRLVREADQYFGRAIERIGGGGQADDLWQELGYWERVLSADYVTGAPSAVDFTLYPFLALALRIAKRQPGLLKDQVIGRRVAAWQERMQSLPVVQRTWPPHWK